MKFDGISVHKPKPKFLVLPHEDLPDQRMVLQLSYLPDMEEFIKLWPKPVPKSMIQRPGQKPQPNIDDPRYLEELTSYYTDISHWAVLASMDARDKNGQRLYPVDDPDREAPGPTFDTIDVTDRSTLKNWEQEMLDAGFNVQITNRVRNEVNARSGLNQSLIDRLTESFLSSRGTLPHENQ